jgi:hypothetical protein
LAAQGIQLSANHSATIESLARGKDHFPARDPIVAVASVASVLVASVLGTIYSFRTDKPFSSNSYAKWMLIDKIAEMLEQLVGWVKDGTLRPGYQ